MNRKANYVTVMQGDSNRLLIRDIGPWDTHPSVTNDAENVVQELVREGMLPVGRRLFYYDSDGQMDEILVKGGTFVGFAPGPRARQGKP